MAYKFQLGAATLSGSTTFEQDLSSDGAMSANSLVSKSTVSGSGALQGASVAVDGAASVGSLDANSGGISNAGAIAGATTVDASGKLTVGGVSDLDGGIDVDAGKFTVSAAGAVSGAAGSFEAITGVSLNVQSGGITNAGAIAGATSIDGSGDLTMGTITMSGFAVDADGDTALKSLAVDDGSTIGTDSDADMLTLTNGSDITVASDLDFNIDKAGGLQLNGTAVTATATELNLLDTAAAGTVVNSKAVIYSAAGKISASAFVIGSADISEAELEVLDDVTAGSVSASKAVVVDSNKDISGFQHVSGSGDARFLALDINGTEVITSARQLAAIASLDATTEATIEAAIDTLASLASAGTSGADLAVKGPLDLEEGLKQNGSQILSDAGALGGLTTISGSGVISGGALTVEGAVTGGKLVVGSADMSEADLEQLDGITAGTAAASKAMVLDASKDISGARDISVDQDLKAARHVSASATLMGGNLLLDTNGTVSTAADPNLLTLKTGELAVDGDMSAVNISGSGRVFGTQITASVGFASNGVSQFGTVQAGTYNGTVLAVDQITGSLNNTLSDGAGIASFSFNNGSSATVALDLNGLGDANVNVANDSIAIVDADASNGSRKESIADLIDAVAGSGLVALNGVLSTDGAAVELKADGQTLVTGVNYFASASADATVDLPATPSVGDRVTAKAAELGDGSKVIIRRQGSHVIDDDQTQIEIESPFGAVTLVYVVANEWRII